MRVPEVPAFLRCKTAVCRRGMGNFYSANRMKNNRMKPDAYMPVYIGDWLKDTGHLDATAQGAYFLLIMHHWGKPGIPCSDESLQQLSRVRLSDWARIKPIIASFFQERDGLWVNRCAERLYNAVLTEYEAKVRGGKTRAEQIRADRSPACHDVDSTMESTPQADSTPQGNQNQNQNQNKNHPTAKRGVVLKELPASLKTPRVQEKWSLWMNVRRGMKKPKCWEILFNEQIEWLSKYSEDQVFEILSASIRNGWQGLFEPKHENSKRTGAENPRNFGMPSTGKQAGERAVAELRARGDIK